MNNNTLMKDYNSINNLNVIKTSIDSLTNTMIEDPL
jgi:hypothetical protein